MSQIIAESRNRVEWFSQAVEFDGSTAG